MDVQPAPPAALALEGLAFRFEEAPVLQGLAVRDGALWPVDASASFNCPGPAA